MGQYHSWVNSSVDSPAPSRTQPSRFGCAPAPVGHHHRGQAGTRAALLAQEEHLVRCVSTGCVCLHCQGCDSPEAPSLPLLLPAWLQISFPASSIRICLLLWLCLGSELGVSLAVDTGAVPAAFSLAWGVGWRPCPSLGELVHLGRAEPCQGGPWLSSCGIQVAVLLCCASHGTALRISCELMSAEPLLQKSPAPAGIELGCHTGTWETWIGQELEEEGLQELSFTDTVSCFDLVMCHQRGVLREEVVV